VLTPIPRRRRRSPRQRAGYVLLVVMVGMAVSAVAAAATIPILFGADRRAAAEETAMLMESIARSLYNPVADTGANGNLGFRQAVNKYPAQLWHLTRLFDQTEDRCDGAAYRSNASNEIGKWQDGPNPYSGLPIVEDKGLPTPLGFIHDTLVIASDNDFVEFHLDSLATEDVQYLDLIIDGAADSTAGTLRYKRATGTLAAQHLHLAMYWLPEDGAC
jgi:type II secretory pathway pseudopilin PulG